MNLTFRITLEHKDRTGPTAGKWVRSSVETSHWGSCEQLLTSYVAANPSQEVRLVAELIEAERDLMETQK